MIDKTYLEKIKKQIENEAETLTFKSLHRFKYKNKKCTFISKEF